MKVKRAMHESVQWVEPMTSVKEIARLMRKHDIGAIPIGENDRLIGMVTDRDIVCRCVAEGSDPTKATARQVMSKGIVFCRDLETATCDVCPPRVDRLPKVTTISAHQRHAGAVRTIARHGKRVPRAPIAAAMGGNGQRKRSSGELQKACQVPMQ